MELTNPMVGTKRVQAGFSLVEVIIVSALIVLVFGSLFAGTRYSLELIAGSRAKLSALSLANDRMELFRSLPYDEVGTVAGIPSGVIPQLSTTTLNGINFTERVLVEYVDDPADGQLTATTTDSNGIPSDYKRIKIEISWEIYQTPGQVVLVSNIVPRSIETTVGGGTVRINVIDQDSLPLAGAEVRLMNDTTTTTVDVIRFSDANGVALFSGAPAASQYRVTVTAPGYSTDQTYNATTSNPNPVTAPFAVLESDISTLTFQIDELSDIDITVLSSATFDSADTFFASSTDVASSTNVNVAAGRLRLAGTSGSYVSNGIAYLDVITPAPLVSWEAVSAAVQNQPGTDYRVRFYTLTGGVYTLIPDGDLPNNSAGFSDMIVSLTDLDALAYPSIIPGIELETTDAGETPTVDEFRVFYRSAETTASGVPVEVQGIKVIGTNASSSPIFKYSNSLVTNTSGAIGLLNMEFDSYRVTVPPSFDIAYSCPLLPLNHRGGVDSVVELLLVSDTDNTLQVRVLDDVGTLVPGAEVTLSRTGFTRSIETNPCGRAFFSGLAIDNNYLLTVTKPGYSDVTISPYDVGAGDGATPVIITPL